MNKITFMTSVAKVKSAQEVKQANLARQIKRVFLSCIHSNQRKKSSFLTNRNEGSATHPPPLPTCQTMLLEQSSPVNDKRVAAFIQSLRSLPTKMTLPEMLQLRNQLDTLKGQKRENSSKGAVEDLVRTVTLLQHVQWQRSDLNKIKMLRDNCHQFADKDSSKSENSLLRNDFDALAEVACRNFAICEVIGALNQLLSSQLTYPDIYAKVTMEDDILRIKFNQGPIGNNIQYRCWQLLAWMEEDQPLPELKIKDIDSNRTVKNIDVFINQLRSLPDTMTLPDVLKLRNQFNNLKKRVAARGGKLEEFALTVALLQKVQWQRSDFDKLKILSNICHQFGKHTQEVGEDRVLYGDFDAFVEVACRNFAICEVIEALNKLRSPQLTYPDIYAKVTMEDDILRNKFNQELIGNNIQYRCRQLLAYVEEGQPLPALKIKDIDSNRAVKNIDAFIDQLRSIPANAKVTLPDVLQLRNQLNKLKDQERVHHRGEEVAGSALSMHLSQKVQCLASDLDNIKILRDLCVKFGKNTEYAGENRLAYSDFEAFARVACQQVAIGEVITMLKPRASEFGIEQNQLDYQRIYAQINNNQSFNQGIIGKSVKHRWDELLAWMEKGAKKPPAIKIGKALSLY